jgi:hypothetical protein
VEGALLALGYAVGGLVYVAVAWWLYGAARMTVTGLLGVYWRHRAKTEVAAAVQRVAAVQRPPSRGRRAA